jgi:hypothetical protein
MVLRLSVIEDGRRKGLTAMIEKLKTFAFIARVFFVTYWRLFAPMLIWLAIGGYFGIPFDTILLGFLAVGLTGLGIEISPVVARLRLIEQPKQDFYVVIDANYRRNVLENNWHKAEPYTLNSVYAFHSFEAAKAMYDSVSKEHYPFEKRSPWLEYPDSYMDGSAYEEYEARLWVIPAVSKQEAYDKAYYHDRRRLLGGDYAFADHLLFVTDNNKRREDYIAWWRLRMEYVRYLATRKQTLIDHPDVQPACWELDFDEWCNPDEISNGKGKRERYKPGCAADDPRAHGFA